MKQVIIGGYSNALHAGRTEYNTLQGGYTWSTTAAFRSQVMPTGGALSNFQVTLSAPAGAGDTYTFTIYIDGNPTALAVAITGDTDTFGVDAGSIDVVAGNTVYIDCTPTNSPSNPTAMWSCKFTGSTAGESIVLGGGYCDNGYTTYAPISHGSCSNAAYSDGDTYQVIPTNGGLSKLYVVLASDPGTAPDAYYVRLRVNGVDSDDGGGNPLSVTIVANDTTGNDTTHTISVSASDYVDMICVRVDTPTVSTATGWGLVFTSDTDGESLVLGQSDDDPTNSQTEYNYITTSGYGANWSTSEPKQGGQADTDNAILKKLYILLETAPGASPDQWDFTVREGGASTNITVAITGAATTTGSDTVNTYTMSDYDALAVMLVPTDAPATGKIFWGLVCYIASAVEAEGGAQYLRVSPFGILVVRG